jgi:PAS domain S-box-containing protein
MEIKDKTLKKWQYLFLIGILTFLIATSGFLFYRHQENSLREEKHNELKAIAELKIKQLVQWRKERKADARTIANGPFFIRRVEQWLFNKTNIALKKNIADRLVITQKEHGYESIILASSKGDPLLSVGKPVHHFDLVASEKVIVAAKFDSIHFSDFYYCKLENTIHYDVIAPLVDEKGFTIAVLLLRINPYDYLYPFIQSWPTPSKSSETLILRKEGESVLFLNDLRFRAGAALTLKIPLARKDIPAVQSILGSEGIFEGRDYRGVEVLSDIRRVPGTSWSMVAKVDQEEIYSDLYQQSIIISVLTGILMLLCGIGIMWIYHFRQRNIYKSLWQVQEEFRTTLYSIGDAVITTDKKGKVQYLNVVAEQLTGWKEVDAKNEKLEKIFHIINEDTRARVENPVQLVLKEGHIVGLANHTLLISKGGKETPIVDSGSPIRNKEGIIIGVVLVFRDQTEERASQKLLEDSETKYRRLFEAARDGILILDAETGKIVDVNPFLIEMLGYTHDQFLGKNVWNLGFLKDIVANEEKFSELKQKKYVRYENLPFETSDGRKLDVEFVSNIYLVNHHKVIQCNIRDISERRQAEKALYESEKKFRQVFESSNVGKSLTLPTGEINVNDAFCKMLGYTAEELKNKKWQELTPPDEIDDTQIMIDALLKGEKNSTRFNKRYIKKDGSYIYADVSVTLLRDDNNKPLHFITTVIDITARKHAEEALIESSRKLSEVQKMAQLGNWIWDVRTGKVEWSEEVFNIFRLDPEEFTPHIDSILELSPWPEDHERDKELIRRAMESHEKGNYEQRFLRPDKSVGYYFSTFQGKYDDAGNLICIIGTVQDITERKLSEENILKLNRTYAVLSNINELIVRERDRQKLFEGACKIAVDDGKFLMSWIGMVDEGAENFRPVASAGAVNGYLERLHMTASEIQKGKGPTRVALREGRTVVCNDIEHDECMIPWRDQALAGGYKSMAAFPLNDSSNTIGTINFYSSEVQFFDKEEIRFLEELAMDVSFALKTMAAEENIRKLSSAVEQSGSSVTIANLNGDIEYVNPKFVELTGFSAQEVIGKNPRILKSGETSDEEYKNLWNTITSGKVWRGEFHNRKKNGELYWESATISPIKDADGKITHFIAVKEDVTQQKVLSEELRQVQRLEGLGTLAGGIAHDFNNILGIILAYNSNIKKFKNDSKKMDLATETIAKAVNRGKTLVQQVLTFARKTDTAFGAVNVNDVVMEIMTMIFEMFPKTVTCSQNFDTSIPYINADRSQLHQVLMNLCVNARDAMPNGGVLSISTRMVSVANLRYQHPDALGSSYVCIEVSDTGEGMTDEVRKRIFEPFYTTKGIGKGTGLGLSVTFGVIQSHKGFIDVESEPGKGTTFYLYLPASQPVTPIKETEEITLDKIQGGTETLLVVEDEEMLLMSLQMMLVDKGYNVLTAGDGLKALKMYQEKENDIALVLTDLGLPNMTGLEVCQRIKKMNPKQHIILASGYLDPEMKAEFLKIGIERFLYKPYDLTKVLKMVREVLDKK